MAYVDVADIRQHYREVEAYNDSQILEIMEEVESFAANVLRLYPLPPNHPILKSIIRDLTIARLMLNIASASGEAPGLAVELERQGNRKLYQIRTDGLIVDGLSRGDPDDQVINPYEGKMWTAEDIWTR